MTLQHPEVKGFLRQVERPGPRMRYWVVVVVVVAAASSLVVSCAGLLVI